MSQPDRYKVTIILTATDDYSKYYLGLKGYIEGKIKSALRYLGWVDGPNPWRDDLRITVEKYNEPDTQFTVGL